MFYHKTKYTLGVISCGIISIAIILVVVGFGILMSVSEQRARKAALEYAPAD